MPRVKIDLPEKFSFTTSIAVRMTDLNYGGHVGNDTVLTFLHEARVQYLLSLGDTELNIAGVSLIMADAAIIYQGEMHFGDQLLISIKPVEISRVGFDLIYRIEKKLNEGITKLVLAKTAMICYDYQLKKVASLPQAAKEKLTA